MNITQTNIDRAKRGSVLHCNQVPGLQLRTTPTGRQSFYFYYLDADGHQRRPKLPGGDYPSMSIARAREVAEDWASGIQMGIYPKETASLKQRREERDGALNFGTMRDEWLEYLDKDMSRSFHTIDEYRKTLGVERGYLPNWENRPVTRFTDKDIIRVTNAVKERGKKVAANRLHAALSSFFTWLRNTKKVIKTNPVRDVPKPFPGESRVRAKSGVRVLSFEEIGELWNALEPGETLHDIIKVLLLTGQRKMEVGGALPNELNLKGHHWKLPRARTKTKIRDLDIYLTDTVVDVLEPRVIDDINFPVFPARKYPKNVYSAFSKDLDRLRAKVRFEQNWSLHTLRKTFKTHLKEHLGVADQVVDAIQNHEKEGMDRIYNGATYPEQHRAAMLAWEKLVLQCAAGNPPKQSKVGNNPWGAFHEAA